MKRMVRLLLCSAVLLLLGASASCTGSETHGSTACNVDNETNRTSRNDPPNPTVVKLTDDLFAASISHDSTVLVLFCFITSENCSPFSRKYERASQKLKSMNSRTVLATVDVAEHPALAAAAAVPQNGSPTLRFFKKGMVYDYSGSMSTDSIVEWVLSREGELVHSVNTEQELAELTTSAEFVLVGFFEDNSSYADSLKVYAETWTDGYTNQFAFGFVSNTELASSVGVQEFPSARLYRQAGRKPEDNEFDSVNVTLPLLDDEPSTLEKLVDENRFPLIGEMTRFNHKEYQLRRLPLVWLFVDYADKKYKTYVEMLKPIGKSLEGKASVVYTNGAKHRKFMRQLGGNIRMPGIVIIDDREEKGLDAAPKKYRFKGEFEPTNIASFFEKWDEDTLPVYMRTEGVPAGDSAHDGDVAVAVGLNYEQIVNEDQFVMMKLYSTANRSPKDEDAREAEYKQLAANFKGQDDVVIGQIDVTRNEIGQMVAPTFSKFDLNQLFGRIGYSGSEFIFYPRQVKLDKRNSLVNEPIHYKGLVTAEDMTKWINAALSSFMDQNVDTDVEEIEKQTFAETSMIQDADSPGVIDEGVARTGKIEL